MRAGEDAGPRLERVDLLRGPQGTLFGKDTTAGVLSIQVKSRAA